MKFYNYLNESTTSHEIMDILSNKCKPFLRKMKEERMSTFVYSGRERSEDFFIGQIRKDRKPLHTPKKVHNLLDKLFEQYHGIKLRSKSLFCTINSNDAINYGILYLIFPIDKFEFYHHPDITDLLQYIRNEHNIKNIEVWSKEEHEDMEKDLQEIVQEYQKGLPKIYTDVELMLYGDKYLAVSEKFWLMNNMNDRLEGLLYGV